MSGSEHSAERTGPRQIQSPRGTRDLYPVEAARRRWLLDRWREVSIRHGFEEVDGPTFEESELYAVKSGEGILGELFQAFSGKSPDEVEQVKATGRAPFALRPEFTPTLARMYAARAAGLPKPCKWFMAGPFFRAERPQRGRLREFLQWNCDVIGLDIPPEKWNAEDAEGRAEVAEAKARMDAECIACCVASLTAFGLSAQDVSIRYGSRPVVTSMLRDMRVPEERHDAIFALLDRHAKMSNDDFEHACAAASFDDEGFNARKELCESLLKKGHEWLRSGDGHRKVQFDFSPLARLSKILDEIGLGEWCMPDLSIARGLAYYTGTVFEVIAEGERAVAGGGRYDNLIELFGGPPTPAVGFAMGDVVLSLLLQDKGLMPSDDELMGLVGQHPDVFVISNGAPEADASLRPLVARLRRGTAPQASGLKTQDSRLGTPLHVRHSYKASKNVGKLLKEAGQARARFAVIIEDASTCTVKDLRENRQWEGRVALADLHGRLCDALRA
ncbi:MAG TPA: ATP phosphoribosyltransferase regulatory subunit [Phycisphaerales bacterium]|nr:ATP phosphoribosyltransferase regulatory subunit [Phycisphaerales bacterium]